ncbi:MAG: hypothetical protein QF886_25335, partial [Planctomycetota bacterium]|nr:hypothetical protein [Planctomycetota bacterium]
LLFCWVSIRKSLFGAQSPFIEFSDESGGFRIAVKALEQSLARTVRDLEEVYEMRVNVRAAEGKENSPEVHIVAHGAVFDNYNLHEVRDRIRLTLKNHFQSILQVEEDVQFDVHLERIIPPDKKSASPPGGNEEVREPIEFPVTGPKYPVGEENEGT